MAQVINGGIKVKVIFAMKRVKIERINRMMKSLIVSQNLD